MHKIFILWAIKEERWISFENEIVTLFFFSKKTPTSKIGNELHLLPT